MDWLPIALMAVGLLVLTLGGELLIRGASRLSVYLGLPPLVIGLTVVAYGTSAPEMAVSVQAGLRGFAHIAVANVVGSNIFNILFILGLCALILPLKVTPQLVRRDVPVMIVASLAAWAMAADGTIERGPALLLLAGLAVYTVITLRAGRRDHVRAMDEMADEINVASIPPRTPLRILFSLGLVVVGLVLLVAGSDWFVKGAIAVARWLGVPEVIIGLTIVAAGTSLPEVAASIVAAVKGERDIAIGNAVGSNICNLLAILGVAGAVTPGGLVVAPEMLRLDLPVMVGVALMCWPVFYNGHNITRRDGALMFGGYLVYTAYLVLYAAQSSWRVLLGKYFLLSGLLAVSFLLLLAARAWLHKRRK